jgi:hypothetical protein
MITNVTQNSATSSYNDDELTSTPGVNRKGKK